MKDRIYLKVMFLLSLAGTLFAGYLSGVKIFSGSCAFNEPCPYFLGYPSCWYGFAMFLVMFLVALGGKLGKIKLDHVIKSLGFVSALGILFAGYFTSQELPSLLSGESLGYALGLPTCIYGLVFYILIFALTVFHIGVTHRSKKEVSSDMHDKSDGPSDDKVDASSARG